ncbi:class I SAM-dependent methyltransferase, partial [Vibrio alginolyticus]|uniref:class I SAM-dependent methyltransferase n=1 Tax=Vibrio alginolyticus TaxID=663 RepID=UPI001A8C67AC
GENFTNLTLLDISGKALSKVRERIGEKANRVKFIESDILNVRLPAEYFDIWHDRAVFHFLTDSDEQKKYVEAVRHSLKP